MQRSPWWFVSTLLISCRANALWRYSRCRNCGRSSFPSRYRSSKMANASGPSDRVVPSGRGIDSSSMASSRRRSSSTNMTSCRSVAAAVDDTMAVLDSCSLEHNNRACSVIGEYSTFNIHQDKVEEKERRSTKVKLKYARLRVVGRAREGNQ